jgi:diguanylate cyclase (GGDEF)-like protein
MLTQEMVTVLLIALVVNGIVIASLIVAPRVREWSHRRSMDRAIAAGGSMSGRSPDEVSEAEAGQPWFLTSSANGSFTGDRAPVAPEPIEPAEPIEPFEREEPSDPATGPVPEMASPASWAAWLVEEAARAARYQRPATIVFVELAGLERLADRVGRAAADRLIPPVATTIDRHARAADRLARLSSTRFGVLLVETNEVSAINYVERIRSNCDVWLAAGAVSLRLSVGWAEIRPDRSIDAVVREAEQRLFDDRRRTEPADPAAATATATAGREGVSTVLQASAG